MMKQTKTIEERLEKLEQGQAELTENVYNTFLSITEVLVKFKRDHYETQETKDKLDIMIDEIEDNMQFIYELMDVED
ncbi:MAG: hypothetical protein ACFFDT_28275 [Candidatus Hodarchaeota archaeon]